MKRAILLAIAACSRREPIASCDDDLRGVYAALDERVETPTAGSAIAARGPQHWMLIDHGATLEAYPLFPDGVAGPPHGVPTETDLATFSTLEVAPRVIDFVRVADSKAQALSGTLRRRYMRRGTSCEARVPVHVTRCAGDTLELVLADPAPPIGFSPCTWPGPGPSRVVRWRRG